MKNLLLIAIIILAVGCGGKNESTTDTKPVEEKVVEVKEEAKTEEPLAETKPKTEGVNENELEYREGIYHLKDSDTPYTGKAYELYPDGQKEKEGNFKDGKMDELFISWHHNGQKEAEAIFKDGKLVEGSEKRWNEKGELRER